MAVDFLFARLVTLLATAALEEPLSDRTDLALVRLFEAVSDGDVTFALRALVRLEDFRFTRSGTVPNRRRRIAPWSPRCLL